MVHSLKIGSFDEPSLKFFVVFHHCSFITNITHKFGWFNLTAHVSVELIFPVSKKCVLVQPNFLIAYDNKVQHNVKSLFTLDG